MLPDKMAQSNFILGSILPYIQTFTSKQLGEWLQAICKLDYKLIFCLVSSSDMIYTIDLEVVSILPSSVSNTTLVIKAGCHSLGKKSLIFFKRQLSTTHFLSKRF
jgi:hypothetical protein